ncbi:MAG: hypothetical protein LH619_07595 [Chitinophagaceae bacterium]|nr:hypothetical protein [Chitinophagaceae bacterium]
MKKVIIAIFCFGIFFYSCSENKVKTKTSDESKNQSIGTGSSEISSEDKAIKEWLVGKEWEAENENAPMKFLRVYSMDSAGYTAPRRYSWDYENGRFIMMAEWPLKRVSDTSFTLFVEPTQKTYTFNFVRNL